MVSADQAAVADEEYLDHGVPAVNGHGDDIFVFHVTVGDFLLLGDLFNAVQEVAVFDGFFKFHGV